MANHGSTDSELSGEPALWLGLASGALQLAAAFWLPWPDETVAIVNAALFGLWVALTAKSADQGGSIKAAILGAGQALINVGLVFGWNVSDEQTAAIMLFLTMASAVFIRQTSEPASGQGAHGERSVASL
ncbi:hypothetical protein [Nonomuraea typhae]|uniref:SPW repeat-containing protein n=1 Tax=Nonomuraea typhae TaxID=2603600 RepID=A0ABW7Z8G4_9ACTN